ncbi:MAG: glycerol-3-phosphate dehydrogenase/oxidase [Saprospiraceae bacterium]
MNRNENLRRLEAETFDLCVIGGGASGAGCALDAALRGLRVALIEKTDFAAETSSRSTKLIHGGVRYLEQAFRKLDFGQLRQVRHGLEERHILLQNAPHLARPLGLLTPVFGWWEGLYFSIGLRLYGWFAAGRDHLPPSRWLSKKEALRRMPTLSPRLHSAVLYYDGQFDDARYCLAIVQSAAEAGAVVANHLEVVGFQKDSSGQLCAADAREAFSGNVFSVRARQFLNCTGPFADRLRLAANADSRPRIRPSKGIHIVLPPEVLGSADAMLIPKTRDGRVVFAIPFEGRTMLGTTETEHPDLGAEPLPTPAEVDFLLETAQPFLAQKLDAASVKASFGGLRPLLAAPEKRAAKNLLRDHEVEHDPASGLVSLLGGKWTTYRLMARDAVDFVCQKLGNAEPCRTATHRLAGAENFAPAAWPQLRAAFGLPEDVCRHLLEKYGSRAAKVAALTRDRPELAARILEGWPFIRAEIVHAARAEMACTADDFLARRLRLAFTDRAAAQAAAPVVEAFLQG